MEKRRLSSLLACGLLVGCGPFTNAPAQIHVKSIAPSSVTVSYKTDDKAVTTTTYENPIITFEGEPGSLGATFTKASVTYLDSADVPIKALPVLMLEMHLYVGTSNYRDSSDSKKILLGSGSWLAPIVTRHLIDYGLKKSNDAAAVTAVVALAGKDDAWFPVVREVCIPIAFVGEAQ